MQLLRHHGQQRPLPCWRRSRAGISPGSTRSGRGRSSGLAAGAHQHDTARPAGGGPQQQRGPSPVPGVVPHRGGSRGARRSTPRPSAGGSRPCSQRCCPRRRRRGMPRWGKILEQHVNQDLGAEVRGRATESQRVLGGGWLRPARWATITGYEPRTPRQRLTRGNPWACYRFQRMPEVRGGRWPAASGRTFLPPWPSVSRSV